MARPGKLRDIAEQTLPIEGYWVSRGYPYDGEVPESRLREGRY